MPQCSNCREENPPQAKFCMGCGSGLASVCSQCSIELPPQAKFCISCGTPVPAFGPIPKSPQSSSIKAPTRQRVQPPSHLADRIRASRTSIEGERKQVTVLFADIKGSLETIADLDPEQAREIIDPILEKMMESVHRFEGTVNQVLGDGIMALFGAPLAHEDHAVRGCYAALAMQSAILKLNDQTRRTHGVELQIRVGINSGEVIVRAIDSDLSLEYSAVGLTTHLAARMEHLAAPGSIRLTAHTLALVEGLVHATSLGPTPVKGLDDPIEVFELTGVSTLRTRVQVAAPRGLTRFVGRNAELDALVKTVERVNNGRGEIVALIGEPGVGKSRIVWEFIRSHRLQTWSVLESASVSYGKASAYKPLIDLLKNYFQIEDADNTRRIREKVTGKLLALDRSFELLLPAFLALLDVPFENSEWQSLVPSLRRTRTLDACKRLIVRESQLQPLILVFEDLHWVDAETQAFLDSMVDSLTTCRILLLVNYRPEYSHEWAGKTFYSQLRVDPLTAESAQELLDGLIGNEPDLKPLRDFLIGRTQGNPFFFEESVRTLVETGVLKVEHGRYRMMAALSDSLVPKRVQSILAARIDRLQADDKKLLQTASVIGKDISFPVLKMIANLSEESLIAGLIRLRAAEFFYEISFFPDPEYTFKHALTHEVTYNGMLQERRVTVHAHIVDAMEKVYADRLIEHVERVSHHAVRGQVWEKALRYLKLAGEKSISRSAIEEAVGYFEQARTVIQQLPRSPENIATEMDLAFELRNALHPLGEFDRAMAVLNDARKLAESAEDERRLGRALSFLVTSHRLRGACDEALRVGEQAALIGKSLADLSIQVANNYHVGQTYLQLGAHETAVEILRRNIHLLRGDLVKQRHGMAGLPGVFSRSLMTWSLIELGRFEEAIATSDESLQIANIAGHGYSHAFAEYTSGYIYLRRGEAERALTRLEHGYGLVRSMHFRLDLPFAAGFLGYAYALVGRADEGIQYLEEGIAASESVGMSANRSWLVSLLAEALLLAGKLAEADRRLNEASRLAMDFGEAGWQAWIAFHRAELFAQSGPESLEQSAETYRQAIAQAVPLGMSPLKARAQAGLSAVMRRQGKADESAGLRAEAVESMRALGIQYWLREIEKDLTLTA